MNSDFSYSLGLMHPRVPDWSGRQRINHVKIPAFWRGWLLNSGSLTARFDAICPGHFRVERIRQSFGKASGLECRDLLLPYGSSVWVREVRLIVANCEVGQARTVIPAASLKGKLSSLKHLKNQPIGHFLFRQPSLKRSPIWVSRVVDQESKAHWSRRSIFTINGQPLLITERFHPLFQQYVNQGFQQPAAEAKAMSNE